ncbi:NUMOD3 domain-containing DNA-binding protein, partial [Cupriavidus sp. amp6]|uniref:NUMOD3 domain-containing DNA-binding protein n=1 Tax=Cupriavidus sp. amp6 TaxID=388051 RepID=UPI0018DC7AE0
MNRQKIYDAFIADRRLKEKALLASGDFYDRHHILPRSLGGGNEPENLICLTLIDHIRAHILLGRVHGGSQWIAVKRIFGGHKKRGHHYSRRELERIAIGRKEARKAIQGEGNPMFGRTGEKHPMFGKGHLMPRLTGEKNPMFGRTGE